MKCEDFVIRNGTFQYFTLMPKCSKMVSIYTVLSTILVRSHYHFPYQSLQLFYLHFFGFTVFCFCFVLFSYNFTFFLLMKKQSCESSFRGSDL
ncbi:hypothetical protein AQUCO_02300070v1 [Aquilegia coerulea]|uniref:Uncharacterized protein n=1 Tax=Aquilegia coerulea TaxID=218851 RepID=A0A2G5DC33_AQUCA|nr:hypothetical protein AQUCO_02300070v1 [Aquilegia coerulea]